jgi:phospholipase/lecithinase/hemolysin
MTHTTLLAAALILAQHAAALHQSPGGVGVLGDSYSDEYQFYPPDRATARNWVEILAATRGLDFGPYTEVCRGEPRNRGYAFNWARSDATTDDMITTGQHTGLAAQVARGEVGIVVLFIGGNDFINAMREPDPARAAAETLRRALANHRLATRTILDASPRIRLVLVTLPDIRNLPEFAGPLRAGWLPATTADAFTGAIRRFNAQIRSLAASHPRVALVDLELATRAANLVSTEYVLADGRKLDRLHPGNTLDRFFLADLRHPGTLGQSLMARMFIETVDAKFAAGIAPLHAQEVVALARSVAPSGDPTVARASLDDIGTTGSSPPRAGNSVRAVIRQRAPVPPERTSR